MKTTVSYKVKVVGMNKIFRETEAVYMGALAFFIDVIEKEWASLSAAAQNQKYVTSAVERLTIPTKKRPEAKYDFTEKFVKFPSYLRRSAINKAYGIVSSFHSNHDNWVKKGKKGKEPKLRIHHHSAPVLFKDNMYKQGNTHETAFVKIYTQNRWEWVEVHLRHQDVKYLQKYWTGVRESAPTLEKHGKARYLRFTYTKDSRLNNTKLSEQIIIAVDLGINNDAVCSAMCSNGTVVDRKFINLSSEKARLAQLLNRLKRQQRERGSKSGNKLWKKINQINEYIAQQTANQIIKFAIEQGASVIVSEYLDLKGKLHGSKKQRIALWKKRAIQQMVMTKAHLNGIRVQRVCAKNTSRLAFDGSGIVKRGRYIQDGEEHANYSICVFSSGKTYNCDLSASYNIGTRYFIREKLKPLSATAVSSLEAKVPSLACRTSCTLSTLISLNVETGSVSAARI